MEDHYDIADLRQLISGGRPHFGGIPPPAPLLQQQQDFFSGHHQLTQPPPYQPQHMYDMLMTSSSSSRHQQHLMSSHDHHFRLNINNSPTSRASPPGGSGGRVTVTGATCSGTLSAAGLDSADQPGGGDGGNGRWPRQETLTLLEIRSCLDAKFKEANQKGPLWDEVSRIMSEEHGYQRSGKKCREKFENLYKYYKKTKEGKAGRQDGKHYRFFRQLEALYGETSIPPTTTTTNSSNFIASSSTSLQYHGRGSSNNNHNRSNGDIQVDHNHQDQAFQSHNSLSLSYSSSGFDSSSSEDNDLNTTAYMENDLIEKRRKRRRNWKAKIKDFIDSQMKKLVEKQESWMEKMMKTIESREQERILREEEWRKNVAQRLEREHKFWASERGWIEARDSALLEAIGNISGRDHNNLRANSTRALNNNNNIHEDGSDVVPDNDSIGKQQGDCSWQESEITRLVQLRASMEMRFEQMGCSEDILWEEIAARMACLGDDKSPLMCKRKWDSLNHCLRRNINNNSHQESSFRFFTNGL